MMLTMNFTPEHAKLTIEALQAQLGDICHLISETTGGGELGDTEKLLRDYHEIEKILAQMKSA